MLCRATPLGLPSNTEVLKDRKGPFCTPPCVVTADYWPACLHEATFHKACYSHTITLTISTDSMDRSSNFQAWLARRKGDGASDDSSNASGSSTRRSQGDQSASSGKTSSPSLLLILAHDHQTEKVYEDMSAASVTALKETLHGARRRKCMVLGNFRDTVTLDDISQAYESLRVDGSKKRITTFFLGHGKTSSTGHWLQLAPPGEPMTHFADFNQALGANDSDSDFILMECGSGAAAGMDESIHGKRTVLCVCAASGEGYVEQAAKTVSFIKGLVEKQEAASRFSNWCLSDGFDHRLTPHGLMLEHLASRWHPSQSPCIRTADGSVFSPREAMSSDAHASPFTAEERKYVKKELTQYLTEKEIEDACDRWNASPSLDIDWVAGESTMSASEVTRNRILLTVFTAVRCPSMVLPYESGSGRREDKSAP